MNDFSIATDFEATTLKEALFRFGGASIEELQQVSLRAAEDTFSLYLLAKYWDDPNTYKVRQIFETDKSYYRIYKTEEKI